MQARDEYELVGGKYSPVRERYPPDANSIRLYCKYKVALSFGAFSQARGYHSASTSDGSEAAHFPAVYIDNRA